MRKIFIDFPICGNFELSGRDAHHALTVLRYGVGDTLHVTDSTGATYECVVTAVKGHAAMLMPAYKISDGDVKDGEVILAAGLLKNDKFDWVVQKAAELGVSRIIPVQMENCVVKLNETRRQSRRERWQRIAVEAAKQCGRSDVPAIEEVVDFPGLFSLCGAERFLIPYEKETAPLADVCREVRTGSVVICIGPEGGFSQGEIDYAEEHAPWCRTVSLGPRILRAETAALASLAIIMYERGFK